MRCPADSWKPAAPYPLPAFVPQGSTPPDIHPGARARRAGAL